MSEPPFYFLPEDFDRLLDEIKSLENRIRQIGAEMGESCQQTSETYHDNYTYEDGQRRLDMWARRFKELVFVRDRVQIVEAPEVHEHVAMGRTVTVEDTETGQQRTLRIGSYLNFDQPNVISYHAPVARAIWGAKVGDVRQGNWGGRSVEVAITHVH